MGQPGVAVPTFSALRSGPSSDFHRFISFDVQMTFTEISEQEYWNLGEIHDNLEISGGGGGRSLRRSISNVFGVKAEDMGLENVNRCQHVKVNGTQCGSPALRRRRLCFFHVRCLEQQARILDNQFKQAGFVVPLLEDANAVQMALMQVMQLLATGQMEHRAAGLMLYALQTASCNLRNTKFEAEEVTDVVIDCGTVDATCIGGPQWVEEDFEDEDGGEEAVEEKVAEGEAVAKAGAEEPPEHVSTEEARRKVQRVVMDWVVETVRGEVSRPG